MQFESEKDTALDKALTHVSATRKTEKQVRAFLEKKGYLSAVVEYVIEKMRGYNFLNDEEYAKALVRHYQAKGYGIYKIKDELYRRQVPKDLWEEALAGLEEPDDSIRRFLEKKLTDPQDRKQVKKVSDALIRRGFTWGQVSRGIESFRRDCDDI
jgi:regulatory protein